MQDYCDELTILKLENAALHTACDSWQDAVAPGGWVAEMKQKLADVEERLPLLQDVIERLNTEVSNVLRDYTNLTIACEFLEADSIDNIKARLKAEKRAARLRTVLGSLRIAYVAATVKDASKIALVDRDAILSRVDEVLAEERGTPGGRES